MSLAPWRSPLARALHRNRSLVYSRYVQLATVQADQRPANRTVVFRGFVDGSNQLQFITDQRSQKVEQLRNNPWAEVCWYFPKTREQFRIAGKLQLITHNDSKTELSQAYQTIWQSLSDSARLQFTWPEPGQPKAPQEQFTPLPPAASQSVSNFCLLLLGPVQVDHLELKGEPQNRYRYQLGPGTEWSCDSINP
jgi:PPOX class probable FMN-dependent enzyme